MTALLGIAEAAAQLGIDATLVRRYCRTGRIMAQQIGRAWVLTQEALDAFAAIPRRVGRPATQEHCPAPRSP